MDNLKQDLNRLIDKLPTLPKAKWIQRALEIIVKLSDQEIDRLDWKILSSTLFDMERAFTIFYPYRHTRKVTIFGSARISNATPEYIMASEFAQLITKQGYMIMTGAGGGIMQAGNEGAGAEKSFGLNISLPYEQYANPIVANDPKLIDFKYFFSRKLFMLKESDAIAVFPGGFGTQDEVMECLTLCQTGRYGPVPIILIDKPGGEYWQK
ncbi:MAG TPA: LOG family protein, partial [Allocoleopsis sp.]